MIRQNLNFRRPTRQELQHVPDRNPQATDTRLPASLARLNPDALYLTALRWSRHNLFNHLALHIRQPHIPPIVRIRQPRMIKPQQMQHRRMEIVH